MSILFGEDGYSFGGDANTFGGQRTYVRAGRQFMPFGSIQVWGRFYGSFPFGNFYNYGLYGFGYAVFQRRKSWHGVICIKERYYKSSNPHHPNIIPYQNSFKSAVKAWQDLPQEGKEIYNSYSYPIQMSGYNRFLHYYLKRLPH